MKLETTLAELSALTEFGSKYLIDINDARTTLSRMNQNDVLTYTICHFTDQEILEELDLSDDEVLEFAREKVIDGAWSIDDIISDSDLKDYVQNNFDIDDIYFTEDVIEYLKDHVDAEDYVHIYWK